MGCNFSDGNKKGINDVNALKICIVTKMRKMLSIFSFKIIFIKCGFLWALFYWKFKSACVDVTVVSSFTSFYLYCEKALKVINANASFVIFIMKYKSKGNLKCIDWKHLRYVEF